MAIYSGFSLTNQVTLVGSREPGLSFQVQALQKCTENPRPEDERVPEIPPPSSARLGVAGGFKATNVKPQKDDRNIFQDSHRIQVWYIC
jgi:hypothetical protein